MSFGKPTLVPAFSVHLSEGAFVVGSVAPDTAAADCGLQPGDVVVAFDDQPLERGMIDVLLLGGREAGSEVSVRVQRNGADLRLSLRIQEAPTRFLDVKLLDDRIGYLRLHVVAACDDSTCDSAALVKSALVEFAAASVRALVLDLRSNPGGWGVTRVASLFTDATPIVVYRSRSGDDEPAARQAHEPIWQQPLVILVNEQTTSSAEIIALALRELCGAKIVGQPSAGGLTVPRHESLSQGHVLMFPDRYVLGPRTLHPQPGHRVRPDVIIPNPSPADFAAGRDAQLERALESLRS
jgi:carboxyl-terminal processing protease